MIGRTSSLSKRRRDAVRRRFLLYVLWLCVATVAAPLAGAAEGVPRIGIIIDAGARAGADLLLIELQKAKCEMVERDEIGKVLKEQAFQASFNRTEVQRMGRLLRADGLVLRSASRTGQMSFGRALIEGRTGIVVGSHSISATVVDKVPEGVVSGVGRRVCS
jgi:hypothetical protein